MIEPPPGRSVGDDDASCFGDDDYRHQRSAHVGLGRGTGAAERDDDDADGAIMAAQS